MNRGVLAIRGNKYSIYILNGFFERMRGFIGRPPDGKIFLFPRCNSIHTFFLRFPLDVYFFDKNLYAINCRLSVFPWRVIFGGIKARWCLEIPTNVYPEIKLKLGEKLVIEEKI